MYAKLLKNGAQGLTRTADTRIFSPTHHTLKTGKNSRFLRDTAPENSENSRTKGAFLPDRIRHSQNPTPPPHLSAL